LIGQSCREFIASAVSLGSTIRRSQVLGCEGADFVDQPVVGDVGDADVLRTFTQQNNSAYGTL
jgi:hypothetical protein